MVEPDFNTKREFADPYLISEKELSREIADETHRLWKYGFEVTGPQTPNVQALARHAKVLTMLSRQADVQTAKLVRLTWALVALTVALLLFTAYLSVDTYLKSRAEKSHATP